MGEFKLETERLVIRRFKATDLHDFHEYCCVPELKGCVSWLPHQSLEESKHYLELFMKSQDDYAIVYKSNNKVIGSIAFLKELNRTKQLFGDGTCELGYVLSKAYWGQRLMGEAVECMINYAFNELRLDKLAVCHFSTNTQSKSVILRAGFEYYTQIEEYIKSLNETKTLVYYVMNNEQ